MPSELLLYGVLAALVGLHLLAMLYGLRRYGAPARQAAPESGAVAEGRPSPDDGEVVLCTVCGTANDPYFSFCRSCVADLDENGTRRGPAADA